MINAKTALKFQKETRRKAELERKKKIAAEIEKIDRLITDAAKRGFRKIDFTVSAEKMIEPLIFVLQNDENKYISRKICSTVISIEW